MKYLGLMALSLSMMMTAQANADGGFYVEPGITYEKGNNEIQWGGFLDNSTGDTQGLGVNVKLGMHVADIFFIGADGSYSKPKFKNSANNYDAEATSTLYGVVAGAQMPIVGLRIWAGYILGGELNPDSSGGIDVTFQEAKGPKVGVGFKVLMVSLNVEYMDLEYGKSVIQEAGPFTGTLDNKLKNKLGLVSVSFPLTL